MKLTIALALLLIPSCVVASDAATIKRLMKRIEVLEQRLAVAESTPVERSRVVSVKTAKRLVWIPPRQTCDEDDFTPGRWELRDR